MFNSIKMRHPEKRESSGGLLKALDPGGSRAGNADVGPFDAGDFSRKRLWRWRPSGR